MAEADAEADAAIAGEEAGAEAKAAALERVALGAESYIKAHPQIADKWSNAFLVREA